MAKNQKDNVMDETLDQVHSEKLSIEQMPLETLRDYRLYNEEARKLNKKLKLCKYPIKQCPVELHPTQRVTISNNDKSTHPIKVFLSNHLIHYDETLKAGGTYDLPQCVVSHLTSRGYPVWGYVDLPDGTRETKQVNKTPRFSVVQVFGDYNE